MEKIPIVITNSSIIDYILKKISVEASTKTADSYSVEAFVKEAERLLLIGVAVDERVSTSRDVEYVKKEMQNLISVTEKNITLLNQSFTKILETMLKNNFSGELAKEFKVYKDVVSEMINNAKSVSTDKLVEVEKGLGEIQDKLNPSLDTSYLGVLKKKVGEVQDSVINLLDENNTGSFSFKLKKHTEQLFGKDSLLVQSVSQTVKEFAGDINNNLVALRETLSKKEGEAELLNKTAQMKGELFEEELYVKLGDCAREFSDIVTRTGSVAESGSDKKGDYIYEFSDGFKIVIEAKDVTNLGFKPMLKYLDEAMSLRGCQFSLLVTKYPEQLPNQVGLINVYEGNKMFVSADNVRFALRLIRIYLKMAAAETSSETVDIPAIKNALEAVRNKLQEIRNIKTKLTNTLSTVTKNNSDIVSIVDQLKSDVEYLVDEIERAVN